MRDIEEHVEVYAMVTDRWGGQERVYAGSIAEWASSDAEHMAIWKRARRALILADRTSDPRGWRVAFSVERAS